MTSRLPILLPIAGAVLATVSVYGLREIVGPEVASYVVLLALLGYGGFGMVVAFMVGWPEVRGENDV